MPWHGCKQMPVIEYQSYTDGDRKADFYGSTFEFKKPVKSRLADTRNQQFSVFLRTIYNFLTAPKCKPNEFEKVWNFVAS